MSQKFDRPPFGPRPTIKLTRAQQPRLPAALQPTYTQERNDRKESAQNTLSNQHAAAILASISDGLCTLSANWCVNYLNPAATRMLNISLTQAVGVPIDTLIRIVDEEGSTAGLSMHRPALERGQAVGMRARFLRLDERILHVDYALCPIVIAEHNDNENSNPPLILLQFSDIGAKVKAERAVQELNTQLIAASHRAGMSEIASGILHNVGNVLNSLNVSANLIRETLESTPVDGMGRLAALLTAHKDDLASFFSLDPKGQQVIPYLHTLQQTIQSEHTVLRNESRQLLKHLEHIKAVVSTQQTYAKSETHVDEIVLAELIHDAVELNQNALRHHDVNVHLRCPEALTVCSDPHLILQILVNLLSNASEALEDSRAALRTIEIDVTQTQPNRVTIAVKDFGKGIAEDNLDKVFQASFSTKPEGHGFGLHSSALAARQIGGELRAFSEGPDKGATFSLEIPA